MQQRPHDLDEARRLVAANELVAVASGHLTTEVAVSLEFHELVAFKSLLKRFFSAGPWSDDDAAKLSDLVAPRLAPGVWWEHDLGTGLVMAHGLREGRYELWMTGGSGGAEPSLFDRVFAGPVVPEATPHPRKVKFNVGGTPAPGIWYRRGDEIDDERVASIFADADITDVMVAGDFITVGLARARWEDRLDDVLAQVTGLFWDPAAAASAPPPRTRDELVAEGLAAGTARPEELHLLDPDDAEHRSLLERAAGDDDARVRRLAVATLAQATDAALAQRWVGHGYEDRSRLVRRTAIDAAADREEEALRPLFERALGDDDPWTRWKAVRAIADLGLEASSGAVGALSGDPDFQVRMEVEAALRGA